MRGLRGFTLIELLVTVAVLAILMALAVPSFTDFFQRYRLRGAADEVASLLLTARAEAMTRNRNVAVVFEGTDIDWCVGAIAAAEPATVGDAVVAVPTCDCNGDCVIGDKVTEARASDYAGVVRTATPGSFVFDRLTGAVRPFSDAGTTSFKSPNQKYTLAVTISPLGRGQLCVPNGEPAMSGFPTCGAN